MEPFSWCFIGTGTLAHQVAAQILASEKHRIVSCYTRSFEKGQAFAEKFGCKAYSSPEEAICAPGVEGIYIVTPHNAHYRYAKLALELGKPVLCEKAFTVNARETDALIALAREKGIYLAEAMWTWFSPAANQVKRWVDSGELGQNVTGKFTYHLNSVNYASRVADPKRAGGALLDITIYPVTYAYRLFGFPETIQSTGVVKNGIDLSEEITMTFPGGTVCHVSGSIMDYKGLEAMTLSGTQGKIRVWFYHMANRVTLTKGFFRKKHFRGSGKIFSDYLPEFDTVASEIRLGKSESDLVPLQATSDVMHILDTVRQQIGLVYPDLE